MFDNIINEKQIQPSGGKREGSILFIGGSPGSGKNWVVNNLTDIKGRYKVFDIDDIKELLGKHRNDILEEAFLRYVEGRDDIPEDLKDHIAYAVQDLGFWSQLVQRNHQIDVIHEFLVDNDIFTNKITKFLLSINSKRMPNVAFNATMQNLVSAKHFIDFLVKIGYNTERVEVLWVMTPQSVVDDHVAKRNASRKTDASYIKLTRKNVSKNMLDILQGKSIISDHVSTMYAVVNDPENIQYYDDTNIVEDFKYYKVDLRNQKQVVNTMRKILRGRYI